MDKIVENTDKLLKFVADKFENGELNNDSLVQLVELAGGYLNLRTIPKYRNVTGMSYNGVKNFRTIRNLIGVKFVIDNK